MEQKLAFNQKYTPKRWQIMALFGVVGLVASYALAVLTPMGQALENAALRGADQVPNPEETVAWASLDRITVWSLALAIVLVAAVGLVRRQPLLAAVATSVIVGGQVITQGLKRFILPRPELVSTTGDFTGNSFPSGHTTIAMTVAIAVLLVAPYRWRGVAMFFVVPWASAIGAYTVTAKWHRFSDTLGADLVALTVGAVAAIVLYRSGLIRVNLSKPKLRVIFVVGLAALAVVTFTLGMLLAVAVTGMPLNDPVVEWDAYLGANLLASACSTAALLWYWATWRHLEVAPKSSQPQWVHQT